MAKMAADSKELMVGATNLPAGNKIITSLNIGNIEPINPISTEIRGESIKGATFVNADLRVATFNGVLVNHDMHGMSALEFA